MPDVPLMAPRVLLIPNQFNLNLLLPDVPLKVPSKGTFDQIDWGDEDIIKLIFLLHKIQILNNCILIAL